MLPSRAPRFAPTPWWIILPVIHTPPAAITIENEAELDISRHNGALPMRYCPLLSQLCHARDIRRSGSHAAPAHRRSSGIKMSSRGQAQWLLKSDFFCAQFLLSWEAGFLIFLQTLNSLYRRKMARQVRATCVSIRVSV